MFFFLLAKSEEANDSTITGLTVTVDTDNKENGKGNAKEIEKNICKKKIRHWKSVKFYRIDISICRYICSTFLKQIIPTFILQFFFFNRKFSLSKFIKMQLRPKVLNLR